MKNLNRKKRIIHSYKIKLMWLIFLVIIWTLIFFLEYSLENRVINGLILLTTSFLLIMGILVSDKYYITTGYHPTEKEHEETFKAYFGLHPWQAIYNKTLVFLFIALALLSLVIMISGLVQ